MRAVATLLAGLALAVGLAGCGASSLVDPVAQAADRTTAESSMHMSLTATTTTQGFAGEMKGSGDFDNARKAGAFRMTIEIPGATSITLDEVVDGHVVYVSAPRLAAALPDGKQWMRVDLDKAIKSAGLDLGQLGNANPADTLASLKGVADVETVGTEQLDGAAVTHYRATLDPAKVPSFEKLEKLAHLVFDPVNVWVDGDGHVRQTTMSYSFQVKGQTARMAMEMRFSDFGKPVDVTVPSEAESVDITDEASAGLQSGG